MRLMEGEHVGPFNLGNPGEFTMLELAQVRHHLINLSFFFAFWYCCFHICSFHCSGKKDTVIEKWQVHSCCDCRA
ncbi:hypothetical protein Patl1_27210 [Pistacia atlantica]|uniref:Uncharacterized protein n=1 Tax=Pistacia atlantica TaxID=434234 RepID=A0ACC1BE81_9ROSI|nr:hypothetical protein Patl1_27210 [Pistacia atlantica]